jgi:hypothetical protein
MMAPRRFELGGALDGRLRRGGNKFSHNVAGEGGGARVFGRSARADMVETTRRFVILPAS